MDLDLAVEERQEEQEDGGVQQLQMGRQTQTNLDIRSTLRGGCFSLGYFWTQGDGSEHDGLTG